MKALSIKQPYASLIAHGIKNIENRNWRTHFRGRIYIHASGAKVIDCLRVLNEEQYLIAQKHFLKLAWNKFSDLPISAIIGEVDIIDCVINHESIWAEKTDFSQEDPQSIWNWVLANPVLYDKPILNVKGKLSFWEWNGCEQKCESCEKDFDMDTMQRDGDDNYFCKECADELFPLMIKEYQELQDRDKLLKFGKLETFIQSDKHFEFLITDGFTQNIDNTMKCMGICLEIAQGYPYAKKCITEDNKFHLILTKEKK
jgi:hypothetical protein